jgi:TPR repeat protein
LVNIAQFYYAGHGPIPADPKCCTDYFHRAVELGDSESIITLAHYYQIGFGVEQTNKKHLDLNQRAADAGNVKGNYNLGVTLEFGHFSPIDDELAFKHYFIAANGGIPQAQHNLEQGRRH